MLAWIAATVGIAGLSLPAIAWVHLLALGSFTVAAFSVLLHAIPAFTDLPWRFERVARAALAVFSIAIVAFVASLALAPRYAGAAGLAVFAALATYAIAALATLSGNQPIERTERAVARALAITIVVLLLAAAAGALLAGYVSGNATAAWIGRLPFAHGALGLFGWLSLLVYGVSMRTIRPISGAKSRALWPHVVVGTATVAGAIGLSVSLAFEAVPAVWICAALVAIAAVVYVGDIADTLRRATVRHRPPQAFVAAACTWLLVALVLGGAALTGKPLALAFGFVLLAGWIGQMVNAHVLHIGIRVVATLYRGDDDETRPEALLDARLSWLAFALFQAAIAAAAYGLAAQKAGSVEIGAGLGFAAWLTTIANVAIARGRAIATPPLVIS